MIMNKKNPTALVQESQTELTQILQARQTEFAEAQQIIDAAERYLALSTLTKKCATLTTDSDKNTQEKLKQYDASKEPEELTVSVARGLFRAGIIGTLVTLTATAFSIVTPPVGFLIIIASIAVAAGGGLIEKNSLQERKVYQQHIKEFYQKITNLSQEIETQEKNLAANHYNELAKSPHFPKAQEIFQKAAAAERAKPPVKRSHDLPQEPGGFFS